MTHNQLSEYEIYRETIKRILLVVGLWPSSEPLSLSLRLLIYVQLIVTLGLIAAIICFLIANMTNVPAVALGISVLMSYTTTFLKFTWMLVKRENVSKLHRMLDPHFHELLTRPTLPSNLLSGVGSFRRMTWVLTTFMCASMIVYTVTPLAFIVYQHLQQIKPVQYLYMHPAIYPWDVSTTAGIGCKLLFIGELIPNIPLICVTIGVDALFTLHTFQMIGQMREMSHRVMQHIDEDEKHCKIAIRECVEQYKTLIECRELLEEVYGPMILWVMVTNALILCGVMFQISQMKSVSIGRLVMFAMYFITILTETMMYAWSGSILTEESENYKNSLYSTSWYDNKSLTTSILIMLTQKSMILTACKFSYVSLDIFTKVLNTTLSYYFLLKTMQDTD